METLRDVVEGAGLSGNFIHSDILNGIKPAFSDKVNEVRVAAYQCLNAIAKFTSNFSYLDGNKGGLSLCVKVCCFWNDVPICRIWMIVQ